MHDDLINEKFRARDAALVVAVASMDKRLESMNEFRSSLRDQAATLLTRAEHETTLVTLGQLRVDLSRYITRVEESEKTSTSERAQLDKRLESMNEFRLQLKDQAAAFVTRTELDATIVRLAENGHRLEGRATQIEARLAMWDGRFWAVGILFVLLNLAVSYFVSTHLINLPG